MTAVARSLRPSFYDLAGLGGQGAAAAPPMQLGPKHAKRCTVSCFVHYYKNCKVQYLSVISKMGLLAVCTHALVT